MDVSPWILFPPSMKTPEGVVCHHTTQAGKILRRMENHPSPQPWYRVTSADALAWRCPEFEGTALVMVVDGVDHAVGGAGVIIGKHRCVEDRRSVSGTQI